MKKNSFLFVFSFLFIACFAQTNDRIKSPWAEKLNASNPLPEYPRPQMIRNNWINLNGQWDFAIQPKIEEKPPLSFDGKIIVPLLWNLFYQELQKLLEKIVCFGIKKGLSAAIYTQTTDVEIEVNGLLTYDRKVMKMPIEKLRAANTKLYKPLANIRN